MSDNDVEIQHPQYENRQYEWRQMRDTSHGTTEVKRSGTLYLPMPNAMLFSPKINTPDGILTDSGGTNQDLNSSKVLESRAPWAHANPAYSAYLQRARFPDITAACLRGLVGVATKQDPEIKLPSSLSYLEDNCTPDGRSLSDLYEWMIDEVLTMGRVELLVDPKDDGSGEVTFVTYTAESFINWKSATILGETEATLAVFEEQVSGEEDEFSHDTVKGQNVLRIGFVPDEPDTLVYTKQEYKDGVANSPVIIPTVRGQSLDRIPVVVANAQWVGLSVGSSPTLGISDIAISIYQKDADKSQSEYLTCNPMLVTSGVDSEEVPNIVGSAVSWNLPNESALAYYVEPAGNCLQHMNDTMKNLFEEATYYGASLLGPEKKMAESAETVSLRQAAQGATLKQVCNNVGEAIQKGLEIAAEWSGAMGGVSFEPNLEFAETTLSPEEQRVLLQSWMNFAISDETYFENLKKAGVQPPDRTFEEERNLILSKPPVIDTSTLTNAIESRPDRQTKNVTGDGIA